MPPARYGVRQGSQPAGRPGRGFELKMENRKTPWKVDLRMMRFLIVSEEPARLNGLRAGLMKQPQIKIDVVTSVDGVMKEISGVVPSLVVVDEYIAGVSGKELIETMIKKNPMINTALVSGLTPEDFHEFTEGLGILMQIPGDAGEDVADDMVQKLEKLYSLYK